MDARHHGRRAVTTALAAALLLGGGATSVASTPPAPATGPVTGLAASLAAAPRITRTDAPVALRVGAARQTFHIAVQTDQPMDGARVRLVGGGGRLGASGTSAAALPGRPTTQRAAVTVEARSLPSWGRLAWELSAWRTTGVDCTLLDSSVRVDVRAHTQAALRGVERSGDSVELRGALRAYHSVRERMVPWAGRPVEVQRHDGTAWRRIATATTDRNGSVAVRVAVRPGTYLRLVAADTPTIWGVTSPATKV